jgi:putative tricarboxylic transport membrane protein
MRKHDYPPAPLLLALVLGEMMEQGLRRALTLSNGDWTVFVTRPISLGLLIIALLSPSYSVIKYLRKKKRPS